MLAVVHGARACDGHGDETSLVKAGDDLGLVDDGAHGQRVVAGLERHV